MKSFGFGLSFLLFALCALGYREFLLQPDGRLHVYFLDIGQGDATLIVSPSGTQVLIDGGPNTDVLRHLGLYMPFFDRTIELLVLTHPDTDHLVALPDVLERYSIDHIMLSGIDDGNARYRGILDAATRKHISVLQPDPDLDIDLGDGVLFDVIWPDQSVFGMEPENTNDTSVVLRLLFDGHSILLTGDIEKPAEHAILASGRDIRSDILKSPHHGSKTSSSTGFLLAVQPDLVTVSAGRGNSYGHPHKEILDRYTALGIDMRSTAEEGTIALEW